MSSSASAPREHRATRSPAADTIISGAAAAAAALPPPAQMVKAARMASVSIPVAVRTSVFVDMYAPKAIADRAVQSQGIAKTGSNVSTGSAR